MPSKPRPPHRCPCGSRERYVDCCGPLHRGRETGEPTAPTAERLMRSRYSAFALGDDDYLLATWDPLTRPSAIEPGPKIEWRQLEVRGSTAGGEDDVKGTVEFVALYWDFTEGEIGRLHENSRFRRVDGQWFYSGDADPA